MATVSEVPVLGLRSTGAPSTGGGTLRDEVSKVGGELIVARSAAPGRRRTDARTHGDFDEDSPTMTSVVDAGPGGPCRPESYAYQSYAPLRDPDIVPWPRRGTRGCRAPRGRCRRGPGPCRRAPRGAGERGTPLPMAAGRPPTAVQAAVQPEVQATKGRSASRRG